MKQASVLHKLHQCERQISYFNHLFEIFWAIFRKNGLITGSCFSHISVQGGSVVGPPPDSNPLQSGSAASEETTELLGLPRDVGVVRRLLQRQSGLSGDETIATHLIQYIKCLKNKHILENLQLIETISE